MTKSLEEKANFKGHKKEGLKAVLESFQGDGRRRDNVSVDRHNVL